MDTVSQRRSRRSWKDALDRAAVSAAARRMAGLLHRGGVLGRTALARQFDGAYCPDLFSGLTPNNPIGAEVANLSIEYGGRRAVEDLTGTFAPASLTAVVGPNGAGKTSLLKALAGVIAPRTGEIRCPVRGTPRLAYLPQQSELDRAFPVTVGELIALGAWASFGSFRPAPDHLKPRIGEAAAAVAVDGLLTRPISELSAGEFQRALFARLMLQDSSLILLDEPFAAVDESTTQDLLALIRRWQKERRTVIAVLHDLTQVREYFPASLLLARSCVAWGETAGVLTQENLTRARRVLRAPN